MTPTIACVLRSGGPDYSVEWVYALKRGLNRYVDEFNFVCLTDAEGIPPMWRRPLRYEWPGWWSKLELFRPGLFDEGERVFFFDLDTLIVGPIDDVLGYEGEFGMIRGFYKDVLQSAVMSWTPGPISRELWRDWKARPAEHMSNFRGDGRWMNSRLRGKADVLLDLYPGRIVSFKVHAREKIPDGAGIVCGHGQPRFSNPRAGWAHRLWTSIKAIP